MTSAIVVAGGASRRMGFDKLATKLCGKPILRHTVEVFVYHPGIDQIIVVGHPARLDDHRRMLAGVDKLAGIVAGGAERHLSVWEGLKLAQELGCSLVAVHDAARPLISPEDITACLAVAYSHGAATVARRVTETLQREQDEGFIGESVDRERLWAMETPQAFQFDLLYQAYVTLIAAGDSATDETSVVRKTGGAVRLVESTSLNMKITVPADLAVAEAWLAAQSSL